MKGKQVSIHNLKGGMQSDRDARRIPNQAFQKLVNVEYNRQGRLVKTRGYDLMEIACSGEVKDIHRIENNAGEEVGYLIGEDKTRFVSSLNQGPLQDHSFALCRSKFLSGGSDRQFYISEDGAGLRSLRKWYYSSPYGKDGLAGIEASNLSKAFVGLTGNTTTIRINQKDIVNDDSTIKIGKSSYSNLIIRMTNPTPYFSPGNKVKAIYFPVKSDTITGTVNITLKTVSGLDGGLLSTDTASFTHGDARITVPLASPRILFDESVGTVISINLGHDGTLGENITLHRGLKLYAESIDDFTNQYYDREPVMGFGLDLTTLAPGSYSYAIAIEDISGSIGNQGDSVSLAKLDTNVAEVFLYSLAPILQARPDNAEISKVIFGRSLVGGGTIYQLYSMDYAVLLSRSAMTSTSPWVAGGSEALLPPNYFIDLIPDSDLSATPLPTNHYPPFGIDPLMYSLTLFRSRAWVLARIVDVADVTRTFLRYSEVDIFDYWDPLNELSIPDDLIGSQPLREDMLLVWSRFRTYRVSPVGSGFEWLKIADIGIGGPDLPSYIGKTEASQLSWATNEAIYWVNQFGLYKYDGAAVVFLPASNQVLSYIQKIIQGNGVFQSFEKGQQLWLSGTIDEGNCIMVLDYFNNTISLQIREKKIISISELEEVYFGLTGGIAKQSLGWSEEGNPLESTIISKRFQANDFSRIRLYYFGISYVTQTEGILNLEFEFSTGKKVTKTIDISSPETGKIVSEIIQVYGEGDWFQFKITHNQDENFEILDMELGATPTTLMFAEMPSNA